MDCKLERLSILQDVKTSPLLWMELFLINAESRNIDAELNELLFEPQWCETASNRHKLELRIQDFWHDFLLDLEGTVKFVIVRG